MNSERIKEILAKTAYPDSRSVHQALLQVWDECAQEAQPLPSLPSPDYQRGQEDMKEVVLQVIHEEAWKWVNSGTVGVDVCNTLKVKVRALPAQQESVCECKAAPAHRIGFKFCPYCGRPIRLGGGDER